MRDNDTAETTRESQEPPDLDSPTEDLVYADEVDWDQEAMLSGLINEDMVKEIASQLARATVRDEDGRSKNRDASSSDAEVEAGDPADSEDTRELEPDELEAYEEQVRQAAYETQEALDDHETYDDHDDHDDHDDRDGREGREGREPYDQEALDDIIEDILDDGVREGVPDAVAFTESPLAPGQELRVLDRYGPPTAGVGLMVLGVTVAVAFAVGTIVRHQAAYFLSPVEMTVALTVLLGSFAYLLCRSWFKQAWEHRSHVIDAAAATVLELESHSSTRSDDTRQLFEETTGELYARLRAEVDERSEKLREDTHRDVQKMRIFFESLLEKHVKRLNDDLREKTSEIEKLRLHQQDGEKTDAELVRLTKGNERLKTQLEDLELELEQVDKDRRLKEDELEELRLQHQAESKGRNREVEATEQAHMESASENERLMSELTELEAELESKGEECKRLASELEELVRGADSTSQGSLDLFDRVSGQLSRNLQLASRLAAQLSGGGGAGGDSESSIATEISGHLENLERLISQVADLGKLRSSSWNTMSSEVQVKDVLQECVERVRATADQSGIKVLVRTAKEMPTVSVDRRLVARAVDELVANAVVYTNPGGRVTVRARVEGEGEDPDVLCLSVQDNGQGMTRAELKNIFEPFERGKHPRLSLSGAGAGLGLALAKGYADKLGGDIEVESKHGKGSTFTIKVPVEVVS